jgi:hypothetical protein
VLRRNQKPSRWIAGRCVRAGWTIVVDVDELDELVLDDTVVVVVDVEVLVDVDVLVEVLVEVDVLVEVLVDVDVDVLVEVDVLVDVVEVGVTLSHVMLTLSVASLAVSAMGLPVPPSFVVSVSQSDPSFVSAPVGA